MPISFVCFLSLRVCKWWECSLNYIKKVYIKNKKSQVTIYFAMLPTTFEKSSFLSLKTFIFSIFVFLLVANNFSTHFVLFVGNSGSNMLCNCWWIFYYFILFFFKYHVFFNSFSFSAELEFFILPVILLTWYWVQTSGLWSRSKCLKKEMLYCSDPHWILYTWLLNCAVLLLSNMTLALLFSKSSG